MGITKEQIIEREEYLGGTDCAAILGLSKWRSPLQVFMSKVHPNRDDSEFKIGGKNEAAYWGTKLEDKVAEAFAEVTGKKVYRVNETLTHPEYPFIRANIDRRVVGEDALLECKTATVFKAKEWEGEEIPAEYILQVQHYLAVTGKDKGYIACLIGGQKFIWKELHRDEQLIKQIVDAEIAFWNDFVLTKQPPMVTGSDRDSDLLDRLYADPEEKIVDLPEELAQRMMVRTMNQTSIKALEEKNTLIENQIKAELKEATTGKVGDYLVTWKGQSRESVDSKKLKEANPVIWDLYKKTTEFRVLKISKVKEKVNGKH